jgi:hypothetical protein
MIYVREQFVIVTDLPVEEWLFSATTGKRKGSRFTARMSEVAEPGVEKR